MNLALIILRYRLPRHPRPFRVPLSIGRLPIFPVAATLSIIVLLVSFDREIYVTSGILLLSAAMAFAVRNFWQAKQS